MWFKQWQNELQFCSKTSDTLLFYETHFCKDCSQRLLDMNVQ